MVDSLKKIFVMLALVLTAGRVSAFSLVGGYDTWQVSQIGYQTTGDVGGPQALGEEYRWNSPTVVYGIDPSYFNYFGQLGADEIDKAFGILNDLPAASAMSADLSEFPTDTRRFNYSAAALGITDIKSTALTYILEQIGLTSSERYVFTLRARTATPNPAVFTYTVLKRSFDPVSWQPSSYVNGTLYTYSIQETLPVALIFEAVPIAVDPLAPSLTSVSALSASISQGTMDPRGSVVLSSPGMFYSGLTRDDVGGLRYIYNSSNLNVENLPANTQSGSATGGGTPIGGSSPWLPVGGGGTNTTGTTTTTGPVILASRPGVDKLTFVRASYDLVLGGFTTNVIRYSDNYVTNGTLRQQTVSRVIVQPDIIFTAADLGLNVNGTPIAVTRTVNYINNSTINGTAGRPIMNGPGQIEGPVYINFSNSAPWFFNVTETREENATVGFAWGSFDASTNAPVVYPSASSFQELEQSIFSKSGGNPWALP